MIDDQDDFQDEWVEFVEEGLEKFATYAVGYVSTKRVLEIVKRAMLRAAQDKEMGQVASALMLGASRRNLDRIAKKRTSISTLTLSRAVVMVLARAYPRVMGAYDVMEAVLKYEHLKEADQRRIEEVLNWAINEEWVVKQGSGYQLADESQVHSPSSLSSRRKKLASHGSGVLDAAHSYLKGEPAAGFHVVSVGTSPAKFGRLMEHLHQSVVTFFENNVDSKQESQDEADFNLFFLTRRKPKG